MYAGVGVHVRKEGHLQRKNPRQNGVILPPTILRLVLGSWAWGLGGLCMCSCP